MALIEIVLFAEQCAGEPNAKREPVIQWLDGVPLSARLGLIARLELLERRGSNLEGPHVICLGERLRAVWCRCQGTRHLILYAVCQGHEKGGMPRAILLHGCSISEPLSIVRDAAPAVSSPRNRNVSRARGRLATAAASPRQQNEAGLVTLSEKWANHIPQLEVAVAEERLELYETGLAASSGLT
jgi:hypothetical protein